MRLIAAHSSDSIFFVRSVGSFMNAKQREVGGCQHIFSRYAFILLLLESGGSSPLFQPWLCYYIKTSSCCLSYERLQVTSQRSGNVDDGGLKQFVPMYERLALWKNITRAAAPNGRKWAQEGRETFSPIALALSLHLSLLMYYVHLRRPATTVMGVGWWALLCGFDLCFAAACDLTWQWWWPSKEFRPEQVAGCELTQLNKREIVISSAQKNETFFRRIEQDRRWRNCWAREKSRSAWPPRRDRPPPSPQCS